MIYKIKFHKVINILMLEDMIRGLTFLKKTTKRQVDLIYLF